METLFTEAERTRIREAVAAAEGRTSGEIVPYIVPQSSAYASVVWKGASFFAVVTLAIVLVFFQVYQGWGFEWLHTEWGAALVALVAGSIGALVTAYVAGFRRLMVGEAAMVGATHRRAMQAFVEEEVFNTRERTGILLFISLFEHRIEVLGDTGINQRVSVDDWVDVVDVIRTGIKNNELANGLVDAITKCGALLERSGVEIRPDDTNELSDGVRVRKA